MARIDFETKSDRELLVLTAQSANATNERLDKINGTLLRHETRLAKLESKPCKDKATIILWGTLLGALIYSLGLSIGIW